MQTLATTSNDQQGAESGEKPVTVLALHGYRQTNDDLARPLGRLLKTRPGEPRICLVFPTAPVVVTDDSDGRPESLRSERDTSMRAWWNRPSRSLHDAFTYAEFDDACAAVERAIAGKTVDAVVGFSQGAVMATLLLQRGALPDCKCALLYGPSGVQDPALAALPVVPNVPALLVQGEKDPLCTMDDARKLGAAYQDARYATHRWGHVVPTNGANRDMAVDFLLGALGATACPLAKSM